MKLGLLLSLFIFVSCLKDPQSETELEIKKSSIIGGSVVLPEDALSKSVVGIVVNSRGLWNTSCTGVVLNRKFILTAAHCLEWIKPENLLISFSLKSIAREYD